MKRRRKARIRSGAGSLPSRKLLRSITSRGRYVLRKTKPRRHHSEERGVIRGVRDPLCQMSRADAILQAMGTNTWRKP